MKNKIATLLFGFAGMVFCGSIYAMDIKACELPVTSQQIFECSKVRYELADRNINLAYKKLIKKIAKSYSADLELRVEYKSRVRDSQFVWIKLRDANCSVETFFIDPGSAAFETTKNNCLSRETEERMKYVERLSSELY